MVYDQVYNRDKIIYRTVLCFHTWQKGWTKCKVLFDVFFLSQSFLKTNQIRQANQQTREGNQIEQIQQNICALKLYEFLITFKSTQNLRLNKYGSEFLIWKAYRDSSPKNYISPLNYSHFVDSRSGDI